MIDVTPLDPGLCREHVRRALAEDLGWGDVTTDALVTGTQRARARIVATRAATLAGIALAGEAFRQLDPLAAIERHAGDGTAIADGDVVLEVRGSAGAVLTAERTARNFLSRLTGIATATRQCVDVARGCLVRSSRDTTPGVRALEHYAVRVGGGAPYRGALDAAVVATATHLQFATDLASGVRQVLALQADLPTTIEVRTPTEIEVALDAGAHRLVFGPAWEGDLAAGIGCVAGRAAIDVIVADEHGLAALSSETLHQVACVVVPALTASPAPVAFAFVAEPEDGAGG